jgi:hypothetical protein
MKKLLRLIYLILLGTATISSSQAQPSLTSANYLAVLGEHFKLKMANYLPPGNAGANQTWNFSALTTSSNTTLDYLSRSAAPYPANVPAATLVSKSSAGEYQYAQTTTSALKIHGAYVAAQNMFITYSNSMDIAFPKNYNSTSTDTYKASYTTNGLNFIRSGTATFTYDGYGTVITPAGTFTNVVRLKTTDVVRDSASLAPGFPYIINITIETYDYIKPGVHHPIARMTKLTSGTNIQYRGLYLDYAALGEEEELAKELELNLFPNPATSVATLQYKLKTPAEVKISLVNMIGEEVLVLKQGNVPAESQKQEIPVGDLPKGVYFVRLNIGNEVFTKRLLVQ